MIARTKKRIRLTVPATASVWYIGTNILAKGITFAFTPIFTRLLSPAEYGTYSLYISWMGIFTVLCTFEMYGSVSYRGLLRWREEKSRFISSGFGAVSLIVGIATAIYIIFAKSINAITGLSYPLTLILILQVFLNAAEGFYFAEKRYSYKYKTVSFLNTASGILTPTLAVIIIKYAVIDSGARILASLLVSLSFVIPMIISIIKRGRKVYDREIWKYLFRIALPMLPHYIALSLMAQGDKIIISRLLGAEELGKYHVAYSIGFIIAPITTGIASALTPWVTRKAQSGEKERVSDALECAFGASVILVLMLFSLLPEVFLFLGGEKFYSALTAAYPVGMAVIFLFLSGILSSYILCFTTPDKITANTVLSALIGLISSAALAPHIGIMGGSIGTLLSYFTLFVLNFTTAKKVTSSPPIRITGLIGSTLLLFAGALLLWALSFSPISRFILFILLLFLFLPKAKKWSALLFEKSA